MRLARQLDGLAARGACRRVGWALFLDGLSELCERERGVADHANVARERPARVLRFHVDLQKRLPAWIDELRVFVGGVRRAQPRADREHEIGLADDSV